MSLRRSREGGRKRFILLERATTINICIHFWVTFAFVQFSFVTWHYLMIDCWLLVLLEMSKDTVASWFYKGLWWSLSPIRIVRKFYLQVRKGKRMHYLFSETSRQTSELNCPSSGGRDCNWLWSNQSSCRAGRDPICPGWNNKQILIFIQVKGPECPRK